MVVRCSPCISPNGFFMNWASANKGEGFEYHLLAIAMAAGGNDRGAGATSVDRALSGSDSSHPQLDRRAGMPGPVRHDAGMRCRIRATPR